MCLIDVAASAFPAGVGKFHPRVESRHQGHQLLTALQPQQQYYYYSMLIQMKVERSRSYDPYDYCYYVLKFYLVLLITYIMHLYYFINKENS